VLQELPRFPGKGGDLLFVALRSPVIRDRGLALRALSLWPDELPDGLRTEVARRARDDPYDEWREAAAAVLRGEPMPEPPDEADPFESDDS
jgi:hypothetical protein